MLLYVSASFTSLHMAVVRIRVSQNSTKHFVEFSPLTGLDMDGGYVSSLRLGRKDSVIRDRILSSTCYRTLPNTCYYFWTSAEAAMTHVTVLSRRGVLSHTCAEGERSLDSRHSGRSEASIPPLPLESARAPVCRFVFLSLPQGQMDNLGDGG